MTVATVIPMFDHQVDRARTGAVLSDDGVYRYSLWREWADGERMTFVMLNPSTADATVDDQTIGRCIGFAKREGYAGINVVNLFAYRATHPVELGRCPVDVVGPRNDHWIRRVTSAAPVVVVAWGASPYATSLRVRAVRQLIAKPLLCLGTTKDGSPLHPSRLSRDTPLVPWSAP